MGSNAQTRKMNRKRRRRRGRSVFFTALCFLLALVALVTGMTVFFKVSTVTVEGESRYDPKEIIAQTGIKSGQNMFLLNKFSAIDAIYTACPYLDTVVIRRKLPDRIVIHITECVPVAAVEQNGKWLIIDAKGKLLEETDEAGAKPYCRIRGVELDKPKVGNSIVFTETQKDKQKPLFTILNTASEHAILNKIGQIDMSLVFDIRLNWEDRFTVVLGTVEQLEKKVRFLGHVVGELGETDRGMIDVSDAQTARFRPYSE